MSSTSIKKKTYIKSPLRYPGGKSRVSEELVGLFPELSEYREPFVGGGSVFLMTKQRIPTATFWINDLFKDLYCFWKELKEDPEKLTNGVKTIRTIYSEGRTLFETLNSDKHTPSDDMENAVKFFCLNRITFSGTTMSGGYSNEAFTKRFTESSIERCLKTAPLLENVTITNLDYSELLKRDGENVFLFMDPPYYLGKKSKLYGKDGNMHQNFDHERFFSECRDCKHKWLITYNDCEYIRELFKDYAISDLNFSYGMSNDKNGREIIIKNY